MQIVIDISDKAYEYSKSRMALFLDVNTEILNAVKNGTPLPKGHGRLIDADDIDNHIIGHVDTSDCPTIIGADVEREGNT